MDMRSVRVLGQHDYMYVYTSRREFNLQARRIALSDQ